MLSHLISLDTRQPASLKQPRTSVYNLPAPHLNAAHVHTDTFFKKTTTTKKHKAKAEDRSWEEEGGGQCRRERLNTSLLNGDGRLSRLRLIPVNISGDVRSTFLRINYKARLDATLSISHSKVP